MHLVSLEQALPKQHEIGAIIRWDISLHRETWILKKKHLSKYDVEASMDCLHAASKEFWGGKQNKQVLSKI